MRLITAALLALPTAAFAQDGMPSRSIEPEPYGAFGEYSFYTPETMPDLGQKVYFQNLLDGETVTTPVFMEFGMLGMNPRPAGVESQGYPVGHHHLLVNRGVDSITPGEPMPNEDGLIHFGDGATSATVDLPPGTHTLQLVAGDPNHVPFDPMVASDPITITVVE